MNKDELLRDRLQQELEMFRSLGVRAVPEGYKYDSIDHFLVERGSLFRHESLDADEKTELKKIIRHTDFPVKCCFANAFTLAWRGRSLGFQYFEGKAIAPNIEIMTFMHAWVVWHNKPIDVTWRDHDDLRTGVDACLERIERNIQAAAYVGIPIPLSYMRQLQIDTKTYSSALDDWENKWPMLKQDFSFEKGDFNAQRRGK